MLPSGIVMTLQLILGLSILVVLHELGHYLAARAFGIKVEKFFLFFDAWGFKIFSFTYKGTEYGIGWLPFGGYVKISGMIDESMDKEQMKLAPQPWEFRSKPAWQRLIVMVAGVVMNAMLGILIFTCLLLFVEKSYIPTSEIKEGIYAYPLGRNIGFVNGDQLIEVNGKKVVRYKDATSLNVFFGSEFSVLRGSKTIKVKIPDDYYQYLKKQNELPIFGYDNHSFIIDSILTSSNAEKAGLKKGDKILRIDDTIAETYGRFKEILYSKKNKDVLLLVLRDSTFSLSAKLDDKGKLGFTIKAPIYKSVDYTIGSSLKFGFKDARDFLVANIKGFKKIFQGKENASDSLQGPIGIAKIYGGVWDWGKFWFITGILSLILAFMNILPIPALDGGHVIFLLVELITGRKLSDNFLEKAQMVGMFILLALMAFAFGNDIFKLFK